MKNTNKYFKTPLIVAHTIAIILMFLLVYFKNLDFEMFFLSLIGNQLFVFFFFSLPLLILHNNYLFFNKNIDLVLNLSCRKLDIYNKRNHTIKTINFDEIDVIYKVISFNRSLLHFGYMDYFYYELVLNNGDSEIVTCLICDDLDVYFDKKKVKLISKFYPLIKYSQHH